MKYIPYAIERPLRGLGFRLTRKLKERHPTEVWAEIESSTITLRAFAGRFGNVSRYELSVLCAVAKHIGSRSVFEFGTFDGLTTWHIAANCGVEVRISTLDLPFDHSARVAVGHDRSVGKIQGTTVGYHFLGTPEAQQIEQLLVDSMEFDPSPYRGRMDLCFIDAGHGYEHVLRDTENALVMTKPGGVIVWHDYSRWWPGVQRCLDDLSVKFPVFRVAETNLAALVMPGNRDLTTDSVRKVVGANMSTA